MFLLISSSCEPFWDEDYSRDKIRAHIEYDD